MVIVAEARNLKPNAVDVSGGGEVEGGDNVNTES
jgi:hypothetical protein